MSINNLDNLDNLIIGIPRELKENEYRVSLVPDEVEKLISNLKIKVIVQKGAGIGAHYTDEDYKNKGAIIIDTIDEVYKEANLIIKVKEPQESEYQFINENHTIMTFFHFGGNPKLKEAMVKSNACCIPYETIKDDNNNYPILLPMSIIAGESSMIEAINFIINNANIDNTQIRAIPITIIGVGNAGKASAFKARELGYTNINLIDRDYGKIKELERFDFKIYEMNETNLSLLLKKSMIIIGSIYNYNQSATRLITDDLLSLMPENSIFMDIAIDQGGMTSQSIPTTITAPIIKFNQTNIYCVPNIPSTVPREASQKLSKAIYPYVITILSLDSNEKKKRFMVM